MRKLLLILSLLPAIALANPHLHDDYPCGDMPPPGHHKPGHGDPERLPGFLQQLDLSDKQQAEIKTLVKAHRAEIDAKLESLRNVGSEIQRLSFSNDYSDERIQTLFNKATLIHRETALQKAGLDNAIFKRLNAEQQKKLHSKFED